MYTFRNDLDVNERKAFATSRRGYKYQIWIYDKKGKREEVRTYTYRPLCNLVHISRPDGDYSKSIYTEEDKEKSGKCKK